MSFDPWRIFFLGGGGGGQIGVHDEYIDSQILNFSALRN